MINKLVECDDKLACASIHGLDIILAHLCEGQLDLSVYQSSKKNWESINTVVVCNNDMII